MYYKYLKFVFIIKFEKYEKKNCFIVISILISKYFFFFLIE